MREMTNSIMQHRDLADQLDLDRPRLFARSRTLILGAVCAWAAGSALLGYGIYRLLSAL